MDHTDNGDETLDALLLAAAPRVSTITEPVEDELARISVDARNGSAEVRRGRTRKSRAVAFGVACAVVLGGAGAAAASSQVDWGPWDEAEEGEYILSFVVPSGAECLMSIDGIRASDPVLVEALESYLAGPDIKRDADVRAELVALRGDGDRWWVNADGSKVPAWYGTARYPTPDEEYKWAFASAVTAAILAELHTQGYSDAQFSEDGGPTWGYWQSCRKADS